MNWDSWSIIYKVTLGATMSAITTKSIFLPMVGIHSIFQLLHQPQSIDEVNMETFAKFSSFGLTGCRDLGGWGWQLILLECTMSASTRLSSPGLTTCAAGNPSQACAPASTLNPTSTLGHWHRRFILSPTCCPDTFHALLSLIWYKLTLYCDCLWTAFSPTSTLSLNFPGAREFKKTNNLFGIKFP